MNHLLALSVGPVQEFIAAARRTRDLWFGSKLLSDVSLAAAKSVEQSGGRLIFPASSGVDGGIANVVLAALDGPDPEQVARDAKAAVEKAWADKANEAFKEAQGVVRQDLWELQKDDVVEFHAAWVRGTGEYGRDRDRLMRLLAGRKNCRNFVWGQGRGGVPKSSLDGQRESVLKDPEKERWPQGCRAKLRVREGEQLDVVGLVKRVGGGRVAFPSVSRVAADPWIRGNKDRLDLLREVCDKLGNSVIRKLDVNKHPQFKDFPFEGGAVYKNRHKEIREEAERSESDFAPLIEALKGIPEPEPYLAVLVADGDRMGAVIRALPTADENRNFSKDLATFAEKAEAIVHQHNGVLIYAGGDDVLAFLPVDTCLNCARGLYDMFAQILAKYKSQEGSSPTLSVGVAVGHFLENLEDLLDYGRTAEKHAKTPDRDGLAVHLHKRGGSPIRVRMKWETGPDRVLAELADLIQTDAIPGKLAYDLQNIAVAYENWRRPEEALQKDVLRVISAKQPRGQRNAMPRIRQILKERGVNDAAGLRRFVKELLVARQISRANRQAGKAPASPSVPQRPEGDES